MKRMLCFFLCLSLCCGLMAMTAGASNDLVYSSDAVLNASFVKFDNITVKSGATLTIDSGSGFEICGTVTVEPGARIICSGVGRGQFTFSLCRGANVTGMDLYYPQQQPDGNVSVEPIPVEIGQTWDSGMWEGQNPSFKWNKSINGWCLTWTMNGNPFGGPVYHSERDMETAKRNADNLFALNLFRGVGTNADQTPNYALTREATRAEALVMLIRLLGKEEEAVGGSWKHPFTDVPAWADQYVGYAYETGLTRGTGATTFGTGNVTAQQYMTFVLRALGYTDSDTDSTLYNEAMDYAHRAGLTVDDPDAYAICERRFWRADVVVASWRALSAQTKSGMLLAEKLIEQGVFTKEQYQKLL